MEDFFKHANNIKLNPAKKDLMARELLVFMKKHPAGPARLGFFSGLVWQRSVNFAMVSFVMVLMVGGAVGAQAAKALPGDFLYPFKVGVNENVAQVLAFSDQAKLEVNIKLAQIRLQEIEQLSVKNKGNVGVINEAQVTASFNKHAKKASKYIKQIDKAKNSALLETTASNFEISLKAHVEIIDGLQKKNPEKNLQPLVQDIKNAASDVMDLRIKGDDTNNAMPDLNIDVPVNINADFHADAPAKARENALKNNLLK